MEIFQKYLNQSKSNWHNKISEEARSIINAHSQTAPVDIINIAEELGLKVWKSDLGRELSGILKKDSKFGGTSGYMILVHANHHKNRQRFTIAHEVGHFLLHKDKVGDKLVDDQYYRGLSGPLETQANDFAASILMPWHLIQSLMDEGITELKSMAGALEVSRQSLAIRLNLPYDQSWV